MSLSLVNCKQDVGRYSLTNEDFIYKLKQDFHDIFMSIYGPYGGAIIIKNAGGEDFYTSSSQIILQQMLFDHPVSKMISALISAQIKAFGTHGSYVAILCSGLLYRGLKLDVSQTHINDISNYIVQKIECYLIENCSFVAKEIDYSEVSNILGIIRGIVNSKSSYILSDKEKTYFHCKVAECFVKSLPSVATCEEFSPFHISTVEGPSTCHSILKSGLFYKENEKDFPEIQSLIKRKCCSPNKIVIFNVPLAYIKDGPFAATCSVDSYNELITQRLKNLLSKIGVSIIANQKYISEVIKYQLEKEGFLVLERLGTALVTSLAKMSGATLKSGFSIDTPIDESTLGFIGEVDSVELFGKTYIHLMPLENSNCSTFIIAGINRHVTSYLETAARTCIDLLQLIVLKDSRVVSGGGCLEAFLVSALLQVESEQSSWLCQEFDASPLIISEVFDMFIQTFLSLAVKLREGRENNFENYFIDSKYRHLWRRKEHYYDSPSEGENHPFHELESFCVCKSISRCCLDDERDTLTCLMSLRHESNHRILVATRDKSRLLSESNSIEVELMRRSWNINSDSILDYFPAKLNALRISLDAFLELIRVGGCYCGT